MESRVKRIPLEGIEIIGVNPAFKKYIPTGTLTVVQEMISDSLGGHLSGLREWTVESSYVADLPFTDETLQIVSGKYSGRCFVVSGTCDPMRLQGTGELKGLVS